MYQQLILVGNLGKDPESRFTQSGTPVCSLSVATNRKYTDSAGQVMKETCWFRVSVFGKMAQACQQYLHKGSSVLVEGRLTPDKDTGNPKIFVRQDGTPGAAYEVFANNVRFLGGGSGDQAQGQTAAPAQPEPDEAPF